MGCVVRFLAFLSFSSLVAAELEQVLRNNAVGGISQGLAGTGVNQGLITTGVNQRLVGGGVNQGYYGGGVNQGLVGGGVNQEFVGTGVNQGLVGGGVNQEFVSTGVNQGLVNTGVKQGLVGGGVNQGLVGGGSIQQQGFSTGNVVVPRTAGNQLFTSNTGGLNNNQILRGNQQSQIGSSISPFTTGSSLTSQSTNFNDDFGSDSLFSGVNEFGLSDFGGNDNFNTGGLLNSNDNRQAGISSNQLLFGSGVNQGLNQNQGFNRGINQNQGFNLGLNQNQGINQGLNYRSTGFPQTNTQTFQTGLVVPQNNQQRFTGNFQTGVNQVGIPVNQGTSGLFNYGTNQGQTQFPINRGNNLRGFQSTTTTVFPTSGTGVYQQGGTFPRQNQGVSIGVTSGNIGGARILPSNQQGFVNTNRFNTIQPTFVGGNAGRTFQTGQVNQGGFTGYGQTNRGGLGGSNQIISGGALSGSRQITTGGGLIGGGNQQYLSGSGSRGFASQPLILGTQGINNQGVLREGRQDIQFGLPGQNRVTYTIGTYPTSNYRTTSRNNIGGGGNFY